MTSSIKPIKSESRYRTSRLLLDELSINDAGFILQLINTPEWIRFIGNRNINNAEEAVTYIQKIIDNPAVNYWVVKISEGQIPVGIITFIKRDYLNYYDIGFAFLTQYSGQGYAHEATMEVLKDVISYPEHSKILAITIKENTRSIKLLEKLGFKFENEVQDENELLCVYAISKTNFQSV